VYLTQLLGLVKTKTKLPLQGENYDFGIVSFESFGGVMFWDPHVSTHYACPAKENRVNNGSFDRSTKCLIDKLVPKCRRRRGSRLRLGIMQRYLSRGRRPLLTGTVHAYLWACMIELVAFACTSHLMCSICKNSTGHRESVS
jgi:hypothetical protein